MSILNKYLKDTCTIVTEAVNKYGDHEYISEESAPCRFRYIGLLERDVHGERSGSDAMLWLKPDQGVVQGDFIKYDGDYFQIEKMTKAKRLGETRVLFLKCMLNRFNIS